MNRILHVFPYEKFTFDYISKIYECFDFKAHTFYIYGSKPDDAIKSCENYKKNIMFADKTNLLSAIKLMRLISRYDKVVFHSLFLPPIYLAVCSFYINKISEKVFWNIWGADLYDTYWTRNKNLVHRIREIIRRHFIKEIKAVGYIPSDYNYLRQWYNTEAKFYLASYAYEFIDLPTKINENSKKKTIDILIGNSATASCRHINTIDILKKLNCKNMKVWCVLSYPKNNVEYINEVVRYGTEAFGENFIPLTNFMPYEDYMDLLSNIDVAVFNNNRQQALGNIASLLFYGKKVFVSPDNGCLDYFKNMGAIVYSILDLDNKAINENIEIQRTNRRIILDFFSDEKFSSRWDKIFNDVY